MFNLKKVKQLEQRVSDLEKLVQQKHDFIIKKCYFRNEKGQIQKC